MEKKFKIEQRLREQQDRTNGSNICASESQKQSEKNELQNKKI